MKGKWSEADDAYLAANFRDCEMWRMMNHLDRSRDSIHYRAQVLGLKRPNPTLFKPRQVAVGVPFSKGNVPWNVGIKKESGKPARKERTMLRDKIIAMMLAYGNQTVGKLAAATEANPSAIWKACNKMRKANELHVAAYIPAPGKHIIVYALGRGEDAACPESKTMVEVNDPDPYEIQPIPRPALGLWGLVWNTAAQQTTDNSVER